MAANRAYVMAESGTLGPGFDGTEYHPAFGIQYIVLDSAGVAVHGSTVVSLTVGFSYSDNNMDQLITSAVQANESDASLQVYRIP